MSSTSASSRRIQFTSVWRHVRDAVETKGNINERSSQARGYPQLPRPGGAADRADDHGVSDPDVRQPALWNHGRPGRQSLVHRRQAANKIGRITTAGVVTEFPIPTADSAPNGIAAGPDGNLWFTEHAANQIGRITTAGVITEFSIPTVNSVPGGIAAGPDGNLWFTEYVGNQIGRITDGRRRSPNSLFPRPAASLDGIAAGPDGNLWFTEIHRQQDRPDHDGRCRHGVPHPHGQQRSGMYRGRPGRQPLVCGANRSHRADHHGRRHHRVSDPHGRRRACWALRPARMATSGSPNIVRTNRADHHGWRHHRVRRPYGQ